MKILLAEDDEDIRFLFRSMIEQNFENIELIETGCANEFLNYLETQKDIKIIISDYHLRDQSIDSVLAYCKKKNLKLPFLLISGDHGLADQEATLKTFHPASKVLLKPVTYNVLDFHLQKAFEHVNHEVKREDYIPVPPTLFIHLQKCPTDLYIKLSKEKYIKIYNSNADFTSEDQAKYQGKKVDCFFVKQNDFVQFFDSSMVFLQKQISARSLSWAVNATQFSFRLFKERLLNFGVAEKHIEQIENFFEITIRELKSHQSILNILGTMTADSFAFSHSFSTALFAGLILEKSEWCSSANKEKLNLASIFHDISIQDDKLIFEFDALLSYPEELSRQDYRTLIKHPTKSADLLCNTRFDSTDLLNIVQQHHELPDGSGFPKGLGHNQITPLAAVFIVAHHFTIQLFKNSFDKEQKQICLNELKQKFCDGNFKTVMNCLTEAVG